MGWMSPFAASSSRPPGCGKKPMSGASPAATRVLMVVVKSVSAVYSMSIPDSFSNGASAFSKFAFSSPP